MTVLKIMTDSQLHSLLENELAKYPKLKSVRPSNWLTKAGVSVDKVVEFERNRNDHFRLNLPMVLAAPASPSVNPRGKSLLEGMLKKFELFLTKYETIPRAVDKVQEIFDPDWGKNDTKFMSMLTEICAIELLGLKQNMRLLEFEAPLGSGGKGSNPGNADIKLGWQGKEVFSDVKAPTLTDGDLDETTFRQKFEQFGQQDFQKKFRNHQNQGVHRVLMYVYKYSDAVAKLFVKGGKHLMPYNIQHSNGDTGFAQIYWLKQVVFSDGSRSLYLVDWEYDEHELISDLNKTNTFTS